MPALYAAILPIIAIALVSMAVYRGRHEKGRLLYGRSLFAVVLIEMQNTDAGPQALRSHFDLF